MTRESFIATVLPLREKCFRYAVTQLRNRPESEDVAQEIMLRLWDRRERLAQVDNLEAFAIRATRNLCIDRARHSSWRTTDVDALYDAATADTPADVRAEQREAVAAVFGAAERLSEVQRAVFHLREVEQLSYAEIAAALDLSAAQVKVYLHRARKHVRQAIDPAHDPSHAKNVLR